MAENLYRRATKEEREAAWAESRLFYEIQEATNRDVAMAEGAAQEQREIAKNLKSLKLPIEQIRTATGLSFAEIEAL